MALTRCLRVCCVFFNLWQGRNASRSAKRPTSYLEPSLKEGSRSPKKSKHKQPTYDEDAYLGYSAEGVDEDGFNVDPFGPDGTGLGSAKVLCIATLIVLRSSSNMVDPHVPCLRARERAKPLLQVAFEHVSRTPHCISFLFTCSSLFHVLRFPCLREP